MFEGLDGSGKSTQSKLLVERFRKEGAEVRKIDFPQYGTKSAGLVENYLNGKYGSSSEVGPYRASIFFACDRYDASFKLKGWLEKGYFVVCDRYIASNIGHQGGKIKDEEERLEYIKWLYNLEFNLFEVPKPDVTFILKTSPETAREMASDIKDEDKKRKREAYLGDSEVKDLHERDLRHLENALAAYLEAARSFPDNFEVVECLKKGEFLPPDEIHAKIWKLLDKKLNVIKI